MEAAMTNARTYYWRTFPATFIFILIGFLCAMYLPVYYWAGAFLVIVAAILLNSFWAVGFFDKPSKE
jgi:hypothetical protein